MGFWEKQQETMDRESLEQLQLERLQATLHRVYKNVNHYRKTFQKIDFFPEDMRTLEEFRKLPFTTRKDLVDNYPYGMFAVPLREVVRLHTPARNLDNPVVLGFTKNDLANWTDLMARNLTALDIGKEDVVQISLRYGMLTGPFGVQLGAERIGASVIPMSSGNFRAQVKVMRDFKTTTLVSTPTFALSLIKEMDTQGQDPKTLSLRCGIFGAEPWMEETRRVIEGFLPILAADTYGLTDVIGPGVAFECPEKNGMHIAEDHYIAEIIDPDTGEVLPPGEEGELVLTTLSKEAHPLIRFRTGDLTKCLVNECPCGRTHKRIARVGKRVDNLLFVRGSSFEPREIERILMEFSDPPPEFQVVVERIEGEDRISVLVEISDSFFFDEMKRQRAFVENLHKRISDFFGFEVKVRLVEAGGVEPGIRAKDLRFADV